MTGGDCIMVRSGRVLSGSVRIGGAKNSGLKLMAACLLADGDHTLRNMPRIADVAVMADILEEVGVLVGRRVDDPDDLIRVRTPATLVPVAPVEARRIRASIVVLGPLLAREGRAVVPLPGGDDFGHRPIDLHLRGLEALGATCRVEGGYVHAEVATRLRGAPIALEFPSVGATENIVLAATLAEGVTVLDNAAREPEIVDLCRFLVALGVPIEGIGTSRLVVHGVDRASLRPAEHVVVADRVEAATYLAAVGLAGGEIFVEGARADHMEMLLTKLSDMGMAVHGCEDGIVAKAPDRLSAIDVATLPYPGVATDYKPLLTAMLSVADGTSIVTENLFSGRFRYVDELTKLGADIRTDAHHAVVRGVRSLHGAEVIVHDIRAGAALVVAALAAEGETLIREVHHIDRGYDDLVGKLRALGADIERP